MSKVLKMCSHNFFAFNFGKHLVILFWVAFRSGTFLDLGRVVCEGVGVVVEIGVMGDLKNEVINDCSVWQRVVESLIKKGFL